MLEDHQKRILPSLQKFGVIAESTELMIEGIEGGMLNVTESGLPDKESGSGEPLKEIVEGKRHALVPYMTENRTRFFIVKAPNEEFLI